MPWAPWEKYGLGKCSGAFIYVGHSKKGHDSPERNPFRVKP